MIVIADSNIIVSALISPQGSIASILKSRSKIQFVAPSVLLEEIYEHWEKIVFNSSLSVKGLFEDLAFYKSKITFVSSDDIPEKHIKFAYNLVQDIDVDDADFFALHLYKKHKLWTGDKKLIKGLSAKGYAHIFVSTDELKEKLYKKRRRSGSLTLFTMLLV